MPGRFKMSDDSGKTKKLSLSSGKLTLGAIDPSKLRTGPAIGAGRKTVQVEVRRKRAPAAPSRNKRQLRLRRQWLLLRQQQLRYQRQPHHLQTTA